ncbi:MAG TPA: outer membrane protein assembly factor BamD [Pseudobdellovibrionaceae bacterium]|nr:outer membrane protein assembly factor BamD [Pseudobdellovibrionaceae bacterium]
MKNYLRIFSLLFLSTQLAAQSTFASKTNELSKVEKNSQNKKKSKENSKKIKTSKKPNTANANKSTDSKIVEKLESDLSRINSSIDITKNKIRTAIEIGFLPDLYYMLAELLVDKARIMTVLKKESQPGTPESELDFTSEKRVRSEAIETFKLIEERYPTYSELDKVLFTMAQIISHQGSPDEAITIYKKITLKYPMSKYGLKSHLEIGNIFFDKKDFEFAAEQYKKLIQINPNSEESQRALYKNGWCLNYLGKFFEAFQNYRKVLELIQLNPNSLEKNSENSNLQEETLVAMIWPYSELTTQELSEIPDVLNPILFFEKSSPDKSSFRRILNRFGQRMEIKERHKEASDAYLELFRLSDDLVEKKDALEKYYINVKKINVGLLPLWFSKEVSQILWSLSSEEKVKKSTKFDINPYEPILRDVATQIHQMGLKTKRREDLIAAAEAYDNYLWIFPQNKWTSSIQLNMAEAYYRRR